MSYFTSLASMAGTEMDSFSQHVFENPSDRLLTKLWECGWWQVIVFNYLSFVFLMQGCWPMLSYNFIAASIPYDCHSNESIPALANMNTNLSSVLHTTTPTVSLTSPSPLKCITGYNYFPRNDSVNSSIVSEWNLVGDRRFLVELSQTIFMAGNLVGALAVPGMADQYGRKPSHVTCQICGALIGILLHKVNSFSQYVMLMFCYGVMREGLMLTGIVWCLEFIPRQYRSVFGIGFNLYWTLHWAIFTLLAYLIRDWRPLQLALSVPPLIFGISLWWFVPESPAWLIAQHKYKTIRKMIRSHANRVNSTRFPIYFIDTLQNTADASPHYADGTESTCSYLGEAKRYSILDMSPKLVTWTIIFSVLWFQSFTSYYGLTYMLKDQTDNLYLLMLLSGLVELPAYVGGMFILHRFGRRWPLFIHQILAGITLIASGFIPSLSLWWLSLVIHLIAKYAQTFCFATLLIYTPEIYPTTLRGSGLGINSVMGKVAGLLTPESVMLREIAEWIPTLIYGLMGLFVGVLAGAFLPETLSKPMPETMHDVDNLSTYSNPVTRSCYSMPCFRDDENSDDMIIEFNEDDSESPTSMRKPQEMRSEMTPEETFNSEVLMYQLIHEQRLQAEAVKAQKAQKLQEARKVQESRLPMKTVEKSKTAKRVYIRTLSVEQRARDFVESTNNTL